VRDERAAGNVAEERSAIVLISESSLETFRIGKVLGEGLREGDCVALIGELGAGKTSLTQGIAHGLGIPDGFVITSPTFTILNEYPGSGLALYHMDAYRLNGSADLDEMGYEEYLAGRGVMVIEWAERILDAVPREALFVRMTYVDENVRRIEISGCPDRIDSWRGSL
jgi:tRNA threonylcarbamoyladenosine biosynthesis protein TsaE